jgi:hypothetical protein
MCGGALRERLRHVIALERAGAIAVVVLAASLYPLAPAAAASTPGLTIEPAPASAKVSATRPYFVLTAAPGSVQRDAALVTNTSVSPVTLTVSVIGALTAETSGVVYANSGAPSTATAAWVKPDSSQLTVPAHSSAHVTFSITVPASAQPGDHVAGLSFEPVMRSGRAGRAATPSRQHSVLGIEIAVPGPGPPQIALDGLALVPGSNAASVVVTLVDSGLRLCQPQLLVDIHHRGLLPQSFSQPLGTILPGDRIAYPFSWPEPLPLGRDQLVVSATNCGPSVSITGVATLTRAGPGPSVPVIIAGKRTSSSSGWRWWYFALIAAALLAAVLLGLLARRRAKRVRATVPATAPESSGDTADSTRLDVIASEAPHDQGPQIDVIAAEAPLEDGPQQIDVIAAEAPLEDGPQQIDVIAAEAPEAGPHTQSEPSHEDRSTVASPARILLALMLGVLAGRAARRRRRREQAPAAEDVGDR